MRASYRNYYKIAAIILLISKMISSEYSYPFSKIYISVIERKIIFLRKWGEGRRHNSIRQNIQLSYISMLEINIKSRQNLAGHPKIRSRGKVPSSHFPVLPTKSDYSVTHLESQDGPFCGKIRIFQSKVLSCNQEASIN